MRLGKEGVSSKIMSMGSSRNEKWGRWHWSALAVAVEQRTVGVTAKNKSNNNNNNKRTCMCSPTTHPGSFRCAYHKQLAERQKQQTTSFLSVRRYADGEIVRRGLTILIRPSSHHLRRRQAFQPRPTRLSLMSKAQDHL